MNKNIPYVLTKEERINIVGKGRRAKEDEKFQKRYIKTYAAIDIGSSTRVRLNCKTGEMKHLGRTMKLEDFYQWTEDFDGHWESDKGDVWFSLKMITEGGGMQNRSIRELARHLEACLVYIEASKDDTSRFCFIIDGCEILKYQDVLRGVASKYEERFFIGGMREFSESSFVKGNG